MIKRLGSVVTAGIVIPQITGQLCYCILVRIFANAAGYRKQQGNAVITCFEIRQD